MKSQLTLIPTIAIHPTKITSFKEVHWQPYKPIRQKFNYPNSDEKIKYQHLLSSTRSAHGKVSVIAKRKMSKSIEYLLLMANPKKVTSQFTGRLFNYRIAFITLTLPSQQIHSDNEIKSKCLNSFLLELKAFYQVKNYVWRAEKQCNGNIHFHIVIDKYVDWNELRNRWNRIVNKLGYVDNYRKEMKEFHKGGIKIRKDLIKKWEYKKQVRAYSVGQANDWNSPNSTDIHAIKKIRNIKGYLAKYMTKTENKKRLNENDENELKKQTGRIWGCNQQLSNLKGAKIIVDSFIQDEIESIIKQTKCKVYNSSYFSVFEISLKSLVNCKSEILLNEFSKYLFNTFGYSLQKELIISA